MNECTKEGMKGKKRGAEEREVVGTEGREGGGRRKGRRDKG